MRIVILLLSLFASVEVALAQPARVILLRHSEKPASEADVHLSEEGAARARALVPLLTTNLLSATNGLPVALFAPQSTAHGHGRRPYETIAPLAAHLKLPVQRPFLAADYRALAKRVLKDPAFEGKTVLICWVHDYLSALAKELGVRPKPSSWKGDVYDRLWVITYRNGRAVLTDSPQNLLPGDSKE
jgi:hypothetical protein